jgi:hypothetical protein
MVLFGNVFIASGFVWSAMVQRVTQECRLRGPGRFTTEAADDGRRDVVSRGDL